MSKLIFLILCGLFSVQTRPQMPCTVWLHKYRQQHKQQSYISTGRRSWDYFFQLQGWCLPASDTITSAVPPKLCSFSFLCCMTSLWLAEYKNKASFTSSPAHTPHHQFSCIYLHSTLWFLLMLVSIISNHSIVCVLSYLWQLHSTPSSKPYLRFQTSAWVVYMHKLSFKFISSCKKAILLLQKWKKLVKIWLLCSRGSKKDHPITKNIENFKLIKNTYIHTDTEPILE